MEVGSRFPVLKFLKHFCDGEILFKTLLAVPVTPVHFSLNQTVFEDCEAFSILVVLLLDSLVQLVFFHELWTWLDVRGSRFVSQVEEIDVGLHKSLGKEFNSNRLFGHLLVKLEVALLLKVLSATSQVGSRSSFLGSILLGILVEYSSFSGCD